MKDGKVVSGSPLIVKSKAFALEVIQVCKTYFLYNPPKTEDERYAYEIIQKAYLINEKKIEMLDYKKKTNLLENYYKLSPKESKDETH